MSAKTTIDVDALLEADPVFMEKLKKNAAKDYKLIRRTLKGIINGTIEDVRFSRVGSVVTEVTKEASIDQKLKAAKQLKEMEIDKQISDKKEGKKDKNSGKWVDPKESLEEIAAKMEKEKKDKAAAEKAGKIINHPTNKAEGA